MNNEGGEGLLCTKLITGRTDIGAFKQHLRIDTCITYASTLTRYGHAPMICGTAENRLECMEPNADSLHDRR
jgi:hypothetical protein